MIIGCHPPYYYFDYLTKNLRGKWFCQTGKPSSCTWWVDLELCYVNDYDDSVNDVGDDDNDDDNTGLV